MPCTVYDEIVEKQFNLIVMAEDETAAEQLARMAASWYGLNHISKLDVEEVDISQISKI